MKFTTRVIKGKGIGESIVGFPTMNLEIPPSFVAKDGVYACTVWIGATQYAGALHYGATPTFDDQTKVLEIFLLDYKDKVTPLELTFELGAYLRPVATFPSAKALHDQIEKDVQRVRRLSDLK
jgi:riboflavin kinase / FMN adenylyltransferase